MSAPVKYSLFVGNLPHGITDNDLYHLFCSKVTAGKIICVKVKNNTSAGRNSEYGFVSFDKEEAAVQAIELLDGMYHNGRNLKIFWAKESSTASMFVAPGSIVGTFAQIHLSFISTKVYPKINEAAILNHFHQFGNVVDVVIKKHKVETASQSGYGFVRFELSPAGVKSALFAAQEMRRRQMNDIFFDCAVSHELEDQLRQAPELCPADLPEPTNCAATVVSSVVSTVASSAISSSTQDMASSCAPSRSSSSGGDEVNSGRGVPRPPRIDTSCTPYVMPTPTPCYGMYPYTTQYAPSFVYGPPTYTPMMSPVSPARMMGVYPQSYPGAYYAPSPMMGPYTYPL